MQGFNTTLAVWWLNSDSELVFAGDAGTTELTGESERYGIEWTHFCKPAEWLSLDADFAFTSARYRDAPLSRRYSKFRRPRHQRRSRGGIALQFCATVRLRHFGHVPLTESGSVDAGDTTLINFGAGYQYRQLRLAADVFNLINSKANDIGYFYIAPPGRTGRGRRRHT